MSGPAPNLDVRLTRSQSGNILDIDFIGAAVGPLAPSSAPSCSKSELPPARSTVASQESCAGSTALSISNCRRLKILEHRVHKVEMRSKENGDSEEELVVSNLRPFTLKVGVYKSSDDSPVADCSLPLRAALLYENGLPVKQTSSSEPLLVGETDVVALQGAATFKLRITSLSSHRDKQRFRIQVSPQNEGTARAEPLLVVVTDPMKSVTKLGRVSHAMPPMPTPIEMANGFDGLKRKYKETLEAHAQQISALYESQQEILTELANVTELTHKLLGGAAEGGAAVEAAVNGAASTSGCHVSTTAAS